MSLKKTLIVLCAVAVMAMPIMAFAATDNQTLIINASVLARAKLVLAPSVINFPDADPDVTNPIPATENSITVVSTVRTTAAGAVTLTCQADGPDLVSGTDLIAISNVTWTAGGAGYVAGTMNDAAPQRVGSWTGSGAYPGTNAFFLANSWAYNIGAYTQTVHYTLTAP